MTPKHIIKPNEVDAEKAAGKQVYEATRTPSPKPKTKAERLMPQNVGGTEYYAEDNANPNINPNDEARELADTLREPRKNVKPI